MIRSTTTTTPLAAEPRDYSRCPGSDHRGSDNGRVRIEAAPRPTIRLSALTGPIGSVAAATAAFAVIALVDPNQPGHYPTCPFFAMTGHYCPGCGTLRAMHALTEGDISAAAGLNLLAVVSLPVLALVWLLWLRQRWTGAQLARSVPPTLIWAVAIGVLVFGLVRNLPFGAALAP